MKLTNADRCMMIISYQDKLQRVIDYLNRTYICIPVDSAIYQACEILDSAKKAVKAEYSKKKAGR